MQLNKKFLVILLAVSALSCAPQAYSMEWLFGSSEEVRSQQALRLIKAIDNKNLKEGLAAIRAGAHPCTQSLSVAHYTLAHKAALANSTDTLQALLTMQEDAVNATAGPSACTPLHYAALNLNTCPDAFNTLVASGKTHVNTKDRRGLTALMIAAGIGNFEAVQALLARRGVRLDEQDNKGDTALHAAVRGKHAAVEQALRKAGAKTNIAGKNGETIEDIKVKHAQWEEQRKARAEQERVAQVHAAQAQAAQQQLALQLKAERAERERLEAELTNMTADHAVIEDHVRQVVSSAEQLQIKTTELRAQLEQADSQAAATVRAELEKKEAEVLEKEALAQELRATLEAREAEMLHRSELMLQQETTITILRQQLQNNADQERTGLQEVVLAQLHRERRRRGDGPVGPYVTVVETADSASGDSGE